MFLVLEMLVMYFNNNVFVSVLCLLFFATGCLTNRTSCQKRFDESYEDYIQGKGYKGSHSTINEGRYCVLYIPDSAYEMMRLENHGISCIEREVRKAEDSDKKEFAELVLFLMNRAPYKLLHSAHTRNGISWYRFAFHDLGEGKEKYVSSVESPDVEVFIEMKNGGCENPELEVEGADLKSQISLD